MDSAGLSAKAIPLTGEPPAARTFLGSLRRFVLRLTGIDGKRLFGQALASNSGRLLAERLARSSQRALLEAESLREFYGDIELADRGSQNVVLSFIAARIALIEKQLGADEIASSTFADIGDCNGIFIRALHKRGVSLGISAAAMRNTAAKGLSAVIGDAVRVPLRDRSCDYALCFETLEHLVNPFEGLMELHRICRKGAFISVPCVRRTSVYPSARGSGVVADLQHIFELSTDHWKAVISHTPFTIGTCQTIPVVGDRRGWREGLAFGLSGLLQNPDLFHSTFRNFTVFFLVKSQPRG